MVFNYPTLAECYKYAAYDALGRWGGKTIAPGEPPPSAAKTGPG